MSCEPTGPRVVLEYVGIAELQVILGDPGRPLTREHVHRLIKNDPAFPAPYSFLASHKKVWAAYEAAKYAAQRNRKRGYRKEVPDEHA